MNTRPAPAPARARPSPPLFWSAWLVGLVAFAVLAGLAAFYDYFPADLRIARAIQDADLPALGGAAGFANRAGGSLWAMLAWGVAVVGLAAAARWRDAAYVFLTIVPRGANAFVKLLVDQPRPSRDLVRVSEDATGSAFPSGHVTAAVTFYILLAVVAFFAIRQPLLRTALQGFALFMVLMMGPARVYSGAHWPSDVLGSYVLSALFLAPVLRFYRRGGRPPEAVVD